MPLYIRLMREEMERQAPSVILPIIEPEMERKFGEAKAQLMQDFDKHDVTQEMLGGANANSTHLKVGNLFSLLGFNSDERPTDSLRDIINDDVKLDAGTRIKMHRTTMEVQKVVWLPSQDEIKDKAQQANPLEWTSRSWVDLIERGITGFPWFLSNLNWAHPTHKPPNFKNSSRSGTGIEIETRLPGHGSTSPIKYISELMRDFRESLFHK